MRLICYLLLFACLQVSASGYSQRVTLSVQNVPLKQVFNLIEKQTGYSFYYKVESLKNTEEVSVDVKKEALEKVLNLVFKNQPLTYNIVDNNIIVSPKNIVAEQVVVDPFAINISGKVIDADDGTPLTGASIVMKGTNIGTAANKEGFFLFNNIPENSVLIISFTGYKTKEVRITGSEVLTIRLEKAENKVAEVIINTGIVSRKKESFTGATSVYTGDQLKTIGNQNVLQSIKTLDPSFIIQENNLAGSNPNVLPSIEMRGQSSLTTNGLKDQFNNDPNQPLFVLDGFITTLQVISDLDMNRVGSVTLLKDAASTALYGAKAANGVVVIETKKPAPGVVRLSYTGDFSVQAPDLRAYNMMNAEEELEFERLAGRYTTPPTNPSWPLQYYLTNLYNQHLQLVRNGVDTYWLNEPVQTGYTHAHSLYAEGGDNSVRYGLGGNYRDIVGVMKGSGRKSYSGTIDLSYRKGKFNISNKFYINGYSADESPYGSFATYVKAPAYFPKKDENGAVQKYLETGTDYNNRTYYVTNPLYNALLYGIDNTKNLGFSNNLQGIYSITPGLRLQGGPSINQNTSTAVNFISPDNTRFQDSSIFTKGSYANNKTNSVNYQANLGLTYGVVINSVHRLTANARAELEQTNNDYISFKAVGFPAGSNGNPAFSYSYANNSRPASATNVYRRNNLVFSANYDFNNRYFADATLRLDGSTAFGSNKKYTNFWSTGIGWNLHNEKLFKQYPWLNVFRLKASIGTSGNQGFGSLTSVSTYYYDAYINQFGQGVDLATLGNPDLKWQVTTTANIGADMAFLQNRISLTGNIYSKITDPLVVVVSLPSSTGLNSYPMNSGRLNTRGMDLTLRYAVINRPQKRLTWSVGGHAGMFESKYENFGNTLAALNKQNQLNNSLIRYTDGYSPSDLWAVPSLGIDPSTGLEVFLKKNGEYSFYYDANDITRVGNSQPTVQGVLNTMLTYRGFTFSAALRYSYGKDVFNTALYNKVENITTSTVVNNQDKRALYDRWQKPGDIAQFKGIYLVTVTGVGATPMSSRFVQEENYLSGESFSMSYEFLGRSWLKRMHMQNLKVTAYANDIFRISTIKAERGIDYPYANTLSLSVNASF